MHDTTHILGILGEVVDHKALAVRCSNDLAELGADL